jgi:superfamily II DNA helicase RecQ
VKAAKLDSTLDAATYSWVKDEVLCGNMKILYVAPERWVTNTVPHILLR